MRPPNDTEKTTLQSMYYPSAVLRDRDLDNYQEVRKEAESDRESNGENNEGCIKKR